MSRFVGIAAVFILLWSCNQHKNNSSAATPALPDSTALAREVATNYKMGQDGLDFLPLNMERYGQLPPDLTRILNQKYPGWRLPAIPKKFLKQIGDRTAQGPYYIYEDLNQDAVLDYVVQFQLKDSTTLAAYLMSEEGQPIEYILEKHLVLPKRPEIIISKLSTEGRESLAQNKSGTQLFQHAVLVSSATGMRQYIFRDEKFMVQEIGN